MQVLLGTHNQGSVEQAVRLMADLQLEPNKSPVFFGQLLGMSDHLTTVLGKSGYKAFKYVPYGQVRKSTHALGVPSSRGCMLLIVC